MHTKDQIEALIAHFGGTETSCATAVGVSQPTVNAWRRMRHGISPKAAIRIEKASSSSFKAIDLCPELAEFAAVS